MEHPVFPAVEALTGEYTKLWIALCMRETRSDDFAALNAQTDALEAFGLARGLLPERISYPAAGDALILTQNGSPSLGTRYVMSNDFLRSISVRSVSRTIALRNLSLSSSQTNVLTSTWHESKNFGPRRFSTSCPLSSTPKFI